MKTRLVLDALADREEVSVSDEELTERIVFQAQQYQMPPEEFVRRVQEAGQLGAIFSDVRRSKALISAVGAATVTDASGRPVDLSDLLGPEGADEAETVPAAEVADDAAEGAVSDAQVVSADDAQDVQDAEDALDAADAPSPVQPEGGRAATTA